MFLLLSSPEQESDERKCNYERYRGLVQNDFAGSKCLLETTVLWGTETSLGAML